MNSRDIKPLFRHAPRARQVLLALAVTLVWPLTGCSTIASSHTPADPIPAVADQTRSHPGDDRAFDEPQLLRETLEHMQAGLAELLISSRNLGFLLGRHGEFDEALPYYRTAAELLDHLLDLTQDESEEAHQAILGRYAYVYREFVELLLILHARDLPAGDDGPAPSSHSSRTTFIRTVVPAVGREATPTLATRRVTNF